MMDDVSIDNVCVLIKDFINCENDFRDYDINYEDDTYEFWSLQKESYTRDSCEYDISIKRIINADKSLLIITVKLDIDNPFYTDYIQDEHECLINESLLINNESLCRTSSCKEHIEHLIEKLNSVVDVILLRDLGNIKSSLLSLTKDIEKFKSQLIK